MDSEELISDVFIADAVLDSLILKGVMEPMGMNEDGEMIFWFTEEYEKRELNGTD